MPTWSASTTPFSETRVADAEWLTVETAVESSAPVNFEEWGNSSGSMMWDGEE
jgi:hypothetical protein